MERLWKAAIGACGLGAVVSFVLWSLYKDWLHLPIFSRLDKGQTFALMVLFLILTFLAFVVGMVVYLKRGRQAGDTQSRLDLGMMYQIWEGANEISGQALIGPDVIKAVNCLSYTAGEWRGHPAGEDRQVILSHFGESFISLYESVAGCSEVVPGFENSAQPKRCPELITADMATVYREMKAMKA